MFHIGIATKQPPLPEKHELSELGIDFIETCLDIDPMKRPSAAELMDHPWIQEFSAAIAHEMRVNDGLQEVPEEGEEGEGGNEEEEVYEEQAEDVEYIEQQ
jgi:mitogen-activated protein kinase kinase kinase